jgi:transcriptional regulator with XRE-family HTH domain
MGTYDDATLRMWRAKERLTLQHAGKLFGVTRQTVARWEAGPVPDDFDERLAKAAQLLRDKKESARKRLSI